MCIQQKLQSLLKPQSKKMKGIVLAILGLVSIQQALSLNCYVTDNSKLTQQYSQNCDTYTQNAMKRFGIKNPGIQLDSSCYTMKVNTGNPNTEFTVKGCVPSDLCDMLVKPIVKKEAQKKGVFARSMTCTECTYDNCNAWN